ncbi:MAG: hypothetical protein ACLRWQ_14055 [Flavonifractor plautii]
MEPDELRLSPPWTPHWERRRTSWLLDTFSGLSPLVCAGAGLPGGEPPPRGIELGEAGRSRLLDELEGLLRTMQRKMALHLACW